MTHLQNIKKLKEFFHTIKGLDAAILYGSYARQEETNNSDVDIKLIVDTSFQVGLFTQQLENVFSENLLSVRNLNYKNKTVVYFSSEPKIEFTIHKNLSEEKVDRDYLGSEIKFEDIESTILYEKDTSKYNLKNYLENLVSSKVGQNEEKIKKEKVNELIEWFLYAFENSSALHKRSDVYRYYFWYTVTILDVVVQLNYLSKGNSKYYFLPKNFVTNHLDKEEQKEFEELAAVFSLPKANEQKRKLLDFFYKSIQNLPSNLLTKDKIAEIKYFCEAIYKRDFFWNVRDISLNNPKIKKGLLFRTSTLTLVQEDAFFTEFIKEKNIKTVIDLRADREVLESNYSEKSLQLFDWVHAPFDPWNQSAEFKATNNTGTSIEKAYNYFIKECKSSVKKVVETILQTQNPISINCFAGKDRTGIVITFLHLLSGADKETIYTDYLASEMDTNKKYLDIALREIEQHNGIENYLLSCNLTGKQISKLKEKITHNALQTY